MNSDTRQALVQRFTELAGDLNRQVCIERLNDWQELEMAIPQIKSLLLLQDMGSLRMGRIAELLSVAVSAATSILDRLVDRGFVVRLSDPNDRRLVICELTNRGREAIDNFGRIRQERLHVAVDRLDTELLAHVVEAFEMFTDPDRATQEPEHSTDPA